MATKDLSRTVIEGGRYHRNCYERRHSHRAPRHEDRGACAALARAPADADGVVFSRAEPVRKSFHDKLAPAERWLLSHVGRPWRVVEGEIRAAFDTRTIAGQHVVFDHLLPRWDPRRPRYSGAKPGWTVWFHWRFYVDDAGILRAAPRERGRWHHPRAPSAALKRWLGVRRVATHGERTYWLAPTGAVAGDGTLAYRQGRQLDPGERRRFDALDEADRAYATTRLSTRAEKLDEVVRVGGQVIAAGVPGGRQAA